MNAGNHNVSKKVREDLDDCGCNSQPFDEGAGQLVVPDLQQCNRAEGTEYLDWVSHFVDTNRHKTLKLENPPGTTLRIVGLEDTLYRDLDPQVYGWRTHYLPETVNMQVFAVLEPSSCDNPFVLMTCEDKKVYLYDGDVLHVAASSLHCLCDKKIEYPASKSYAYGQFLPVMDWLDTESQTESGSKEVREDLVVSGCRSQSWQEGAGQLVVPDLQQCNRAEGTEYLDWVSHFVATNRHKTLKLENPPGTTLRIAGLEDTNYSTQVYDVKELDNDFLPELVNMRVFGVLEPQCLGNLHVLMTCEDKKVYLYDGELLHVVAAGLDCLYDKKIEYPPSKSYGYEAQVVVLHTESEDLRFRKVWMYLLAHHHSKWTVFHGRHEGAGQLVVPDLQQCNRAEATEYLDWVSHFVATNRHKTLKLKNPPGTTLRIAGLENTVYSEDKDEVNTWRNCLLPETVNMQVFGVLESVCPFHSLVLMTCEDKKVYIYNDGMLDVVASSLNCLLDKKLEYPASDRYNRGFSSNVDFLPIQIFVACASRQQRMKYFKIFSKTLHAQSGNPWKE